MFFVKYQTFSQTTPTPETKTWGPFENAGNVIVMKTRSAQQIDTIYPYDLQFRTLNNDTLLSSEVLPKNGKPTVLLFWLTTCYPCRMELTALKEKYASMQEKADFNLIAISEDWTKNFEQVIKRTKEEAWPWPVYVDINREFGAFLPGELNGLPQTFIIDGNGKLVYHKKKYYTGDEEKLLEALQKLSPKP